MFLRKYVSIRTQNKSNIKKRIFMLRHFSAVNYQTRAHTHTNYMTKNIFINENI